MTGIITTVAGNGRQGVYTADGLPATEAFLSPFDVALDNDGNIYISDEADRIRKVDVGTGTITTVAGSDYFNADFTKVGDGGPAKEALVREPRGITLDGSGNLYIADVYNSRVRKVDAATGIITTVAGKGGFGFSGNGGPAHEAEFHNLNNIAIDNEGILYMADQYNNRIRYLCTTTTLSAGGGTSIRQIDNKENSIAAFAQGCSLRAKLVSGGANPVAGNVKDSVWVNTVVPWHYGIHPEQNASSVTGTLTLYFTQDDFTAYNTAPNHGLDLPHDPADDANNKVNLRIKKRSGTSNDGSGRFDAYSGATTDIVPTSVVWDITLNAWAVTFDVNGFSGFFVTSASSTLPLTLLDFSARQQGSNVLLTWRTVHEEEISDFEVERSTEGRHFAAIGKVAASNRALNHYVFEDKKASNLDAHQVYYRLKIGEQNRTITYSDVVVVSLKQDGYGVALYPNPVRGATTLQVHSPRSEQLQCHVVDGSGRVVHMQNFIVVKGKNYVSLQVNALAPGLYHLRLKGTLMIKEIKFVKQ